MNDPDDTEQPKTPTPVACSALSADSFAYSTIGEYEELVGFKVNDAFRTGWMMARTMNSHIAALSESANDRTMPRRKQPKRSAPGPHIKKPPPEPTMNSKLKLKVAELLDEMLFASEEERLKAFDKLHSNFCPYCGCEETSDAKAGGRRCQCENDE